MKTRIILLTAFALFYLVGCNSDGDKTSVYNGRLDADIVRLSAQVQGTLDSLDIEEGQAVQKGQSLVRINTDKVKAQLRQQAAQKMELDVNLEVIAAQVRELNAQLKLTEDTFNKTNRMVEDGAATTQNRDELQTQVEVLKAKKAALNSNRHLISSRKEQLAAAMDISRITLRDSEISCPINGIVLNKYFEEKELVSPGRVVLEVADLSSMEALIYVPLVDLDEVKIGNEVRVFIDGKKAAFSGTIRWVSSESEFTPKTILTEETRTTLVYAVKVLVPNPDGELKIGMPVEVEM